MITYYGLRLEFKSCLCVKCLHELSEFLAIVGVVYLPLHRFITLGFLFKYYTLIYIKLPFSWPIYKRYHIFTQNSSQQFYERNAAISSYSFFFLPTINCSANNGIKLFSLNGLLFCSRFLLITGESPVKMTLSLI